MVVVSVIMPAYNAERYIAEAINSVLSQTLNSFELIIINDGSIDKTREIISSIKDSRIVVIDHPTNMGVSVARNSGMSIMKGKYFCFLDADDFIPPKSLSSRVDLLEKDKSINFVDGVVVRKDYQLKETQSVYRPAFRGNPRKKLLRLSSACFLGNTWMVRRNAGHHYNFQKNLTHLEDYLFFLQLSESGIYDHVPDEILWYRQTSHSAMANIANLERGYQFIFDFIKSKKLANASELVYLKFRITRILFLSYLFDGKNIARALKSLLNIFR